MLGYLAEIEVERDSIATDRLWLSFSGLSDFEPLGGTSADTIFCPPRQAGMRAFHARHLPETGKALWPGVVCSFNDRPALLIVQPPTLCQDLSGKDSHRT